MSTSQRRWLAASLAWICLIFFSSTSLAGSLSEAGFRWLFGTSPDARHGWLHFAAEKSVHVSLFFILGVLLAMLFAGRARARFARAASAGLLIGAASELLQGLFPDRDPSLRDVLINLCGACLGAWVAVSRRP